MSLFSTAGLWALVLAWSGPEAAGDVDLLRRISAAQIATERLDGDLRGRVDEVLKHGQLYTRGPTECFPCQPGIYRWLLDHPHWGVHAWRALGATKIKLEPQADGSFLGSDQQGGELRWRPILAEAGRRVWYAEGSGRMAPLMPIISVRAVVLLKFQEVQGEDGRIGIRQRTEVFALYDGRAAELACKLIGLTAEAAGKKVIEQIGLFFSGMAWYLSENPEWGLCVLTPTTAGETPRRELAQLHQQLQPLTRTGRAGRLDSSQPRSYVPRP
jgi:hypothetical protein